MLNYIIFQVSIIYRQHHPEHRCFPFLSFPTQEKKELNHNICPFSTGRRAEQLTEKNKSLQPGATECRIWVRWTDGFRMPPCLYLAKSYFEVAHFHRCLKYALCLESFHSKNERVRLT